MYFCTQKEISSLLLRKDYMKKVKAIIAILLFLIAPSISDANALSQYNVGYLNLNTGMPSNYIDDVYRDTNGFMWISTHGGGLVRYDGYTFFNLGLGGNVGFGFLPNSCSNVVEDKFCRLWIAYAEGVRVLDLHTMLMENLQGVSSDVKTVLNRKLSEPVQKVYCDSKGCVWLVKVGSIDRIAFDETGKVSGVLSARHNTKVPDIAIADLDNDGSVYVGLNFQMSHVVVQGGRLIIENLSARYPYLTGSVINAILKWNGKIWFGTNHGLYCIDGRSWHHNGTAQGLQHETVTSLAVTPDGSGLLIGTLCGVDVMDANAHFYYHLNANNQPLQLSSNFVNNIFVNDGCIWIGTETGGITRLVPRLLSLDNYAHVDGDANSISSGPVNAMYSAPNGDLWVGTVEGGLNLKPGGLTASSILPRPTVA